MKTQLLVWVTQNYVLFNRFYEREILRITSGIDEGNTLFIDVQVIQIA